MILERISFVVRLAAVLIIMGTGSVAAMGGFSAPAPGTPVLVIAPPWNGGAAAVLARVGGQEISPVRAPFAVMAIVEMPELARAEGAWAVWDATLMARLCNIET